MAHRIITDSEGRDWDVWSVIPTKVERRSSGPTPKLEFPERRLKSEYRARIGTAMANGWLCFETKGDKRRLAPIPANWERLSDSDLLALCGKAVTAASRRRPPGKGKGTP